MEANPELQVKIKDVSAHLGVIKSNIRIANKELSAILKEKDSAENRYTELLTLIKEASEQLSKISALISGQQDKYKKLINDFDVEKNRLEADLKEFKTHIAKDKATLEIEIASLQFKKKELHLLEVAIKREDKRLLVVKDSIKEYEDKQRKAREEANTAREDAKTEQKKLDKLSAELVEKQKELEDTDRKIREEKELIGTPLMVLQKKEEGFKKQVRDFTVLVRRLQKIWDKQFPGQSVMKLIRMDESD